MAQKNSPKKSARKAPAKKASLPQASSSKSTAKKSDTAKAKVASKKTASSAPAKSPAAPAKRPAPAKAAPVAVVSSAKPAKKEKVQSVSKSDLQYFRGLLLERRREILGDMGSMESEAFKGGSNLSNMPIHMADVGTDNFEQEFTLGLIESERKTLREIQEALIRIDDGTYGICQGTGKAIPKARLEAVPWTKYTMEYSRMLEQGKIGRDVEAASEDDSSDDDED